MAFRVQTLGPRHTGRYGIRVWIQEPGAELQAESLEPRT